MKREKTTLDDRARRALLAQRQLLGPHGRQGRRVLDVAQAVGPLHATDPSSAFLQIAARADVSRDDIRRALYDERLLLRHTTLRRTVHLLTPSLAVAAHGSYNHRLVPALRAQLLKWIAASEDVDGPPDLWLADLEDAVVTAVERLDRPSGAELAAAVPGLQVTVDPAPGKAYSRPMRLTSRILELVIAEGRIARDEPRGADLTSGAWTYASMTDWVAGGLDQLDHKSALVELLAARLTSLPGASIVDLAWWTGLPKGHVRTAVATLDAVEVQRDDGVTGYALPHDDLTPCDVTPGAALLPGLDATPMSCKERAWFLGDHEAALFDRNGNVGPTVWWDGRIVGGWTQRDDGSVVTELLDEIPAEAVAAVAAEAERLRKWLGEVRVRWRYPTPLQTALQ